MERTGFSVGLSLLTPYAFPSLRDAATSPTSQGGAEPRRRLTDDRVGVGLILGQDVVDVVRVGEEEGLFG